MVMEIKNGETWEAFMSERLPQPLDDAIKSDQYCTYFFKAAEQMSPEEMFDYIPMRFPMAHLLTHGGRKMKGIAKYPIADWLRSGSPVMTESGWAAFIIAVSKRDTTHLASLMQLAQTFIKQPMTIPSAPSTPKKRGPTSTTPAAKKVTSASTGQLLAIREEPEPTEPVHGLAEPVGPLQPLTMSSCQRLTGWSQPTSFTQQHEDEGFTVV